MNRVVESQDRKRYDVAVVGAGIIGLAVAREILARLPEAKIVLLEKEAAVSMHQTGHNSGVIHSGIYYTPGSLKAKLCVEGAALMYEYCEQNGVPYERAGKLIVARNAREVEGLKVLHERGVANSVPGLRWLESDEIAEVEPLCVGLAALHSPNTGIVDYAEVCRAVERELREKGVDVMLETEVDRIERTGDVSVLHTNRGRVEASWAVTCAGLWSDELAKRSGADDNPRIVPFRGAYLHLEPTAQVPVVKGMVYPVPDPELPFLGVHITRHINGEISIGPTAFVAGAKDAYKITRLRVGDLWSLAGWPGTWKVGKKFWRTAGTEIKFLLSRKAMKAAAAEFIPEIANRELAKEGAAGIRAQAVDRDGSLVDDFVISEVPGATHVRNAPSPAATSGFALARELVDRFQDRLSVGATRPSTD